MEVLEDRKGWREAFRRGWLAHFEATGEFDWSLYKRPTNTQSPSGPAIDLAGAQLVLISTAGGYLPGEQDQFEAADPLGDYSIRQFPASTGLDRIRSRTDTMTIPRWSSTRKSCFPCACWKRCAKRGELAGFRTVSSA